MTDRPNPNPTRPGIPPADRALIANAVDEIDCHLADLCSGDHGDEALLRADRRYLQAVIDDGPEDRWNLIDALAIATEYPGVREMI